MEKYTGAWPGLGLKVFKEVLGVLPEMPRLEWCTRPQVPQSFQCTSETRGNEAWHLMPCDLCRLKIYYCTNYTKLGRVSFHERGEPGHVHVSGAQNNL